MFETRQQLTLPTQNTCNECFIINSSNQFADVITFGKKKRISIIRRSSTKLLNDPWCLNCSIVISPQLSLYFSFLVCFFPFVSFGLLSLLPLSLPSLYLSFSLSPILDRMTSILNMNCAWIVLSLTQQHTQGQNFVTSSITFSGAKLALVSFFINVTHTVVILNVVFVTSKIMLVCLLSRKSSRITCSSKRWCERVGVKE